MLGILPNELEQIFLKDIKQQLKIEQLFVCVCVESVFLKFQKCQWFSVTGSVRG